MVAKNHTPDRSGADGLREYAAIQAANMIPVIQHGSWAAKCGCPVCRIDEKALKVVCGALLLSAWAALRESGDAPPGIPAGLLDEAVAFIDELRERIPKTLPGFPTG